MAKMVLHMGFLNTPYTRAAKQSPMTFTKKYGAMKRRSFGRAMTAEKVAGYLEGKYNVVQTFTNIHEDDILEMMDGAIRSAAIEALSKRTKFSSERMVQYMKPKTSQVEKLFRSYLDHEETGASVEAASKGKRTGRKSKSPRPPFIDTGIYRASFRTWVDIA